MIIVIIYLSGLQIRMRTRKLFSHFSIKTYVAGTQKKHPYESLFEHPKHMFKLMGEETSSPMGNDRSLGSSILFGDTII